MNREAPIDNPGPGKLAVLCFLPELGHLAPLLRIARHARAAGFEVKAFVAEEARGLVGRSGIPAAFIGPVTPPGTEGLMRDLVRAAGTLRHASAARRFENEYWIPLILSLADGLQRFREDISEFDPNLVLEDSHVIGWIYRDIAPAVPHVIHVAAGSHFACQEPGALEAGFWRRTRARWMDRRFKATYTGLLRVGRVLRQRSWVDDQALRRRMEEAKEAARTRILPVVERTISTGMGVLEEESLSPRIGLCQGVDFFGSLDPSFGAPLDPELTNWLESSERPVALVSFGSMIPSDTEVGRAVLKGLEKVGARILWVSGDVEDGRSGLESTRGPEWFRCERFIPQADVLAHPAVKVFVSHAGSGGIQDGVWNGKPFLCVPMVSDQPYNARVVEALGGGLAIPAREVSVTRVEGAVTRILQDQAFARGARELATRMKEKEGGRKVVELLREVADTR